MRMVGKCSGWWELKCFPLSEIPPVYWMTQEDTRGKKGKEAEDSTLYFPLSRLSAPPHLLLIIVHGVGQAKTCLSTGWVHN